MQHFSKEKCCFEWAVVTEYCRSNWKRQKHHEPVPGPECSATQSSSAPSLASHTASWIWNAGACALCQARVCRRRSAMGCTRQITKSTVYMVCVRHIPPQGPCSLWGSIICGRLEATLEEVKHKDSTALCPGKRRVFLWLNCRGWNPVKHRPQKWLVHTTLVAPHLGKPEG